MRLFHSPGSCSIGIRVLLEHVRASYELVTIETAKGDHRKPEYLALNPKGKVPAFELDDGNMLTEFPVIAQWIARNFPAARLLPGDQLKELRTLELLEYIVSSLHMRGAVFLLRPEKFSADASAQEDLRQHGREVLTEGFAMLAKRLGDSEFFFDGFTVVDAAAFYLLNWKDRVGVALPAELEAYHQRLLKLPAVQRALA